eukprot:XP_011661899.1 PREDICTED: uncharacterized protein LOC105437237 [Strongylocentrotus purpuratus]
MKLRNRNFSLVEDGTDNRLMKSHYVERVKYLLRRDDKRHGCLVYEPNGQMKRLALWIYPTFAGFRYSTRIVCTFGLSLIVLYQMSIIYITRTLIIFQDLVLQFVTTSPEMTKFFETIRLAFHLSSYPAICISFINCILLLRNYRENTRELWKGDRSRFRNRTRAPHSIIVSCLSFSSFSVAYTFYGFLVLQIVLWTIMSCVVAIIRYNFLIQLLDHYWSHIFLIVLLIVIQQLLARFVLLDRKTKGALVINNRFVILFVLSNLIFIPC